MGSNQDFLAIVGGFHCGGAMPFRYGIDPFREAAYRRLGEDIAQGETNPQCGGHPCKHAGGKKRMSAQVEEIVIDARPRNPDLTQSISSPSIFQYR